MLNSNELAPWTNWIGTPKYDSQNVPIYKASETALDAFVHAASLIWVGYMAGVLQTTQVVYLAAATFMFCASAAYNILGCGMYFAPIFLRKVDHAAIFIYIAGCYTPFLTRRWALAFVWLFCIAGATLKLVLGRAFEISGACGYVILRIDVLVFLTNCCWDQALLVLDAPFTSTML